MKRYERRRGLFVMGKPMDRSRRFFWEGGSFEEAFPMLEDAIVEWAEIGRNAGGWNLEEKLRKGEGYKNTDSLKRGGLFYCSNKSCVDGGFEVDHVVHDMVRNKEKTREDRVSCIGHESVPKKLIRMGHLVPPCDNTLYCRITLKYKDEKK